MTKALLHLKNLVKHFDISGGLLDQLRLEKGGIVRRRTTVKAVNDVSFAIARGDLQRGGRKRMRQIDTGADRHRPLSARQRRNLYRGSASTT